MAQRRGGRKRRKVCYFTSNNITHIDYKDVDLLKNSFLNAEKFFHVA